jgi:hypothetical protein
MTKRPWLLYTLVTTLFWGIWGALIELPGRAGFPPTLVYIVWALTMIPCALVGLSIIKWKLDTDLKSVFFGMVIGLTGAGGQIVLFQAGVPDHFVVSCYNSLIICYFFKRDNNKKALGWDNSCPDCHSYDVVPETR